MTPEHEEEPEPVEVADEDILEEHEEDDRRDRYNEFFDDDPFADDGDLDYEDEPSF